MANNDSVRSDGVFELLGEDAPSGVLVHAQESGCASTPFKRSRYSVVVSGNEPFVAAKLRSEINLALNVLPSSQVAKVIHNILGRYCRIPILDECLIHLLNISKRSIAVLINVRVGEMRVARPPGGHAVTLSCIEVLATTWLKNEFMSATSLCSALSQADHWADFGQSGNATSRKYFSRSPK